MLRPRPECSNSSRLGPWCAGNAPRKTTGASFIALTDKGRDGGREAKQRFREIQEEAFSTWTSEERRSTADGLNFLARHINERLEARESD